MEKLLEAVALVGLIGPIVWVALRWSLLPEQIPQHYNFSGEVDSYSGKSSLLLLLWVNCGLWLGLTVLSRYPHIYNYLVTITEQNAARQYLLARRLIVYIKAVITVLFAGITWHIVHTALGGAYPIWPIVTLPIAFILAGTIVYLIVSPNESR